MRQQVKDDALKIVEDQKPKKQNRLEVKKKAQMEANSRLAKGTKAKTSRAAGTYKFYCFRQQRAV